MSKRPDLIAFHVTEPGDERSKSFWTRIGAAWRHDDGEGYNIDLQLLPATGGKIVLRVPKDRDEADQARPSQAAAQAPEDDEIPY